MRKRSDQCWVCGCILYYPISEHICRGRKAVDELIAKNLERIKKKEERIKKEK